MVGIIREDILQTKGPWEYSVFEEYPEERGGYFVYSPGIKPCVTKLTTTGAHSDYDPEKSEAHDNARLIAAAPDLLDACKTALSAIEDTLSDGSSTERGELGKIHTRLRDVISKATGITTLRSIRRSAV
jgi:hypothetical protein